MIETIYYALSCILLNLGTIAAVALGSFTLFAILHFWPKRHSDNA